MEPQGNFEDDIQLIFIEDVVNFCFWAEKDKPKWEVEWPVGKFINGGWFSLKACFERALAEKVPIINADYLSNITLNQVRSFFRGRNGVDIPLIEKRWENLKEAGNVLNQKYSGHFKNLLQDSGKDAPKVVKVIYENFPSFRDISLYKGKEVFFLKRAQICTYDISLVFEEQKSEIVNTDKLTAFADYKLPQTLRKFGVIKYSDELAAKIDNMILIPAGSEEEMEIRANTIWAIELIRQKLGRYTASQIDNALWLMSQNQTEVKPYHRTYTIFY